MIESPLIKEIVAESKHEAILEIVQTRFGSVPEAIWERLRAVGGEKKLKALLKHALRCPNLEALRRRLPI